MGKYNYTYWYLRLRTKEEVNYLSFDSLCMFNVVCATIILYRLAVYVLLLLTMCTLTVLKEVVAENQVKYYMACRVQMVPIIKLDNYCTRS